MTLKEIAIELLDKYEASETVAICEYSTNIDKDTDVLSEEVENYREMIKDADRPKGEWINKHEWDNGFLERECSLCGAMKPILMHTAKINFCPYCGADMKGADNETD